MSASDDLKARQKRNVRTGALNKILAEMAVGAQQATAGVSSSPVEAASTPSVPPSQAGAPAAGAPASAAVVPRGTFFPGKGPATIPPEACRPWELADRPDGEFGHLDDLVRSFRAEGQLQPAVVRPVKDPAHPEIRYEVIAGQARWRAAKAAGTMLDVVVRNMDDETAFRSMVGENEFRRGLSDYAKGRRLAMAFERGLYKDKATMAAAVGLSASQLSYLLGFAELDPVVVARFKDVTAISARLGYVLNNAVRQGFLRQVLRDLGKIESGEIPRDSIPQVWREGEGSKDPSVTGSRIVTPAPQGRVYAGKAGEPIFVVKQSARSGAFVKIDSKIAGRLDESFWEEVRVLMLKRLA